MRKRLQSFVYAGRGIRMVFSSEANMKIHLFIAVFVVMGGFIFRISVSEWIACLLCIGLVFGMEMLNTALEHVVDLASPGHHQLAGKAKDAAAGAVLICALISVVVGVLIFTPKMWCLLQNLF